MKVYKFDNETYHFRMHLIVPGTHKQFAAYVERITGEGCEEPDGGGACVVKPSHVIIGLSEWDSDVQDISILSHECLHAAIGSLVCRGITICNETEEVLCYLQESLLRQCLEALGYK